MSMAVPSDGAYGVEEGLISGFPCTCSGGEWEIVEGLEVDDFSRERIDATRQRAQGGARRGQAAGLDLSRFRGWWAGHRPRL